MKKYSTTEVIAFVVMGALMVGSLVWFVMSPSKSDPECTTEYVQINGEKDCEDRMKADEAESDVLQDRQTR